jgi:hypothetical protein
MYVIIGSHFVQLEGKVLLIALVIVWITLNVIVCQMPLNVQGVSIVQKLVAKLSNTSASRNKFSFIKFVSIFLYSYIFNLENTFILHL